MNQKLKSIENLLLFVNLGIFIFLALCVLITTDNVIKSNLSTEFMFGAEAIVFDAKNLFLIILACCSICLIMMLLEEKYNQYRLMTDIAMGLLLFYIVAKLGFNYNGVFLYLFVRGLSDSERGSFKKVYLVFCVVAVIISDRNVMNSYYPFYSIEYYISFYSGFVQQFLTVVLAILQRINSLVFILYCATYIRVQYENIQKINLLYNELETANSKLIDYAVEREKYGELNERNRIAREIHDTIGHTMTVLSYGLQASLHLIDHSAAEAKEQIRNLCEMTAKGMEELRRSVRALAPQDSLHVQLEDKIRKMVKSSQRLTNIVITCEIDVQRKLFKEDEALVIYRVIQESMTNCFKYSQATKLEIVVKELKQEMLIHIQDDGVGFTGEISGFGTTHIRQRVELLGGTVTYRGTNGFETKVVIPLRVEDAEDLPMK